MERKEQEVKNKFTKELDNCPFCGGKADMEECKPGFFIRCSRGCVEQSKLYRSKRTAAAAWNRRVYKKE